MYSNEAAHEQEVAAGAADFDERFKNGEGRYCDNELCSEYVFGNFGEGRVFCALCRYFGSNELAHEDYVAASTADFDERFRNGEGRYCNSELCSHYVFDDVGDGLCVSCRPDESKPIHGKVNMPNAVCQMIAEYAHRRQDFNLWISWSSDEGGLILCRFPDMPDVQSEHLDELVFTTYDHNNLEDITGCSFPNCNWGLIIKRPLGDIIDLEPPEFCQCEGCDGHCPEFEDLEDGVIFCCLVL